MSQVPVAISLLICEQVIVEEGTKNVTPVNCYTRRAVKQFPASFPMVILATLIDGIGEMPIEVTIQESDTLEELYRRSFPYRFTDPLAELRCVLRI